MYFILSAISGMLIALMVVSNGDLTNFYGTYSATLLTHLIGLITAFIFLLVQVIRKKETLLTHKKIPLYLYIGGFIGVGSVVFCNLAYDHISVSAILALGLFMQSLVSIIIDYFGLFGMTKHPFIKKKIIGILFVLAGCLYMLFPFYTDSVFATIFSLLSGVTVVLSRIVNAKLSEQTSCMKSTLANYITGALLSLGILLIVLISGNSSAEAFGNLSNGFALSGNIIMYLGGFLGMVVVIISNLCTTKISSFYMTLFLFIGQIFTGIIIDYISMQSFSPQNLIGGIAVAIGLSLNLYIEKKQTA